MPFCILPFLKIHKNFMGTKFDYHDKVLLYFQISTIAESEDSQESVDSVTDSQKRREILSRRPSYRYVGS